MVSSIHVIKQEKVKDISYHVAIERKYGTHVTSEDEGLGVGDVPVQDLAVEAANADEAWHHELERRRGLPAVTDRLVEGVDDLRGRRLPDHDDVAVLVRTVAT